MEQNSHESFHLVSALKSGLGVGMLPCLFGDVEPDLQRCLPPIAELDTQTWLVLREDLKHSSHVRAFCRFYFSVRPEIARPVCGHRSSRVTRNLRQAIERALRRCPEQVRARLLRNPSIRRRVMAAHVCDQFYPAWHKRTAADVAAPAASQGIALNAHFAGDGDVVYRHACKLGREGIVSK